MEQVDILSFHRPALLFIWAWSPRANIPAGVARQRRYPRCADQRSASHPDHVL